MTRLRNKNATPEELLSARTDYVNKFAAVKGNNLDPKLKASMDAWVKNPQSPEAQMANDYGFKALLNSELANNPDATPDTFGQIVGQVSDMWNNMDGMSKMGLMVGVPAAMIGLLGGDGLSMLIGALGLGVAGAGSGLFGATAQQFTNDASSYLGSMMGIDGGEGGAAVPAQESQAPAPAAPAAAPADAAQQPVAAAAGAQQPAAASQAIAAAAAKDPNELMGKLKWLKMQSTFSTKSKAEFDAYVSALSNLPEDQLSAMYKNLNPGNRALIKHTLEQSKDPRHAAFLERIKNSSVIDNSRVIDIMLKAARCWAGYEPVPGAKAYSEGSCRPAGSKKTKKEVIQGKKHTEKKAVGRQPAPPMQLQYSDAPLTMDQALAAQKEFLNMGRSHNMYGLMSKAKTPMDVRNALEKYLRVKGSGISALDKRIEKILGGQFVPHTAAEGEFPAPITPAQPEPTQPQQAAKPPAPVGGPAPAAPQPAQAPRPADPVASPSAPPAPAPAPSATPGRPTMTQMPANNVAANKPSPLTTSYNAWRKSQKPVMPTILTSPGKPANPTTPGAAPKLKTQMTPPATVPGMQALSRTR
jgi:hypothetical protein